MIKSQIGFVVFLSMFVFGTTLPTAHAAEEKKSAPAKAKAAPVKAAPVKAAPARGGAVPEKGRVGEVRRGEVRPGEVRAGEVRRGEVRRGEERRDIHREVRSRAEIHHFVGRDYGHWNEHEREIWRGGIWRQEEYMGRVGYWWIAGGQRYFFENPVYPYPTVVPVIAYELPIAAPEPVIVQQPVVIERPAPRFQPQTAQSWYYCDNPPGYAPYITSCASGWRAVPAQMASPPPPPSP